LTMSKSGEKKSPSKMLQIVLFVWLAMLIGLQLSHAKEMGGGVRKIDDEEDLEYLEAMGYYCDDEYCSYYAHDHPNDDISGSGNIFSDEYMDEQADYSPSHFDDDD